MQTFASRLRHFREALLRPVWAGASAAILGVLSSLTFIRDEFLPEKLQGVLRVMEWLPDWGWQSWAIVALIVLFFAWWEGSYRWTRECVRRAREDERQKIQREMQEGRDGARESFEREKLEADIARTEEMRAQRQERESDRHRAIARQIMGLSKDDPLL